MPHYVYVIKSEKTHALYKGMSTDVKLRLQQHNLKKVKSTKHGAPWKLVYHESYESIEEARGREKYLKTAAGRRFLKNKLESW